MNVLLTASTAVVEEVPQRDEDLPTLHPDDTLDRAGREDHPSLLALGQAKIRSALHRWFGGWTFMSVDRFMTHAYLVDMSGFVVISPHFYAVANRTPDPSPTESGTGAAARANSESKEVNLHK